MRIAVLITLFVCSVLPAALAESCLNGGGQCMSPRRCLNDEKGSVSTGLCSGGDDNRCCDLKGSYQCGTKGRGMCDSLISGMMLTEGKVCVSLPRRDVQEHGRVGFARMGMILSVAFDLSLACS